MTRPHLTRRRLLQATSGAAVGLAGAGVPAYASGSDAPWADKAVVPFHGAHQAGIVTPPPDRLMFAAFDLAISTAGELRELLQFAVLQRRLGAKDALNEYIEHRSSAVFAIPAGVARGGYIAQGLFA